LDEHHPILTRSASSLRSQKYSTSSETSDRVNIVSDAGEQQVLHQQKVDANGSETYENHVDLQNSLHSLPAHSPPFELQSNICRAFVSTRRNDVSMPESEFLPSGELCRVINAESVARELAKTLSSSHTLEQVQAYAEIVCRETEAMRKDKMVLRIFRKVFALLVMVEMSSSIPHFLEEDVSDLDLSLNSVKMGGIVELYRRDSAEPLQCFRHPGWSIVKLRNFEKDQWTLLAPFFSQGDNGEVRHYILHDEHILPFVASDETIEANAEYFGGYAKVTMAHIHPDHHNFQDRRLCDRGFAIKQLYERDRESFEKELSMLQKFSGERSHQHIVASLATYEHRDKFHFIFYRANADLFRYWKDIEPQPALSYEDALWVAE
jgi:hypothetical protein